MQPRIAHWYLRCWLGLWKMSFSSFWVYNFVGLRLRDENLPVELGLCRRDLINVMLEAPFLSDALVEDVIGWVSSEDLILGCFRARSRGWPLPLLYPLLSMSRISFMLLFLPDDMKKVFSPYLSAHSGMRCSFVFLVTRATALSDIFRIGCLWVPPYIYILIMSDFDSFSYFPPRVVSSLSSRLTCVVSWARNSVYVIASLMLDWPAGSLPVMVCFGSSLLLCSLG